MDMRCTSLLVPILALTISACADGRYIPNPSAPPADVGALQSRDGLNAELRYVIKPDGPGSWIKGAKWDEWVLTLSNRNGNDMQISAISLIDSRGAYVQSAFPSLAALESATEQTAKAYGQATAQAAAGQAILQGAAQTGVMMVPGGAMLTSLLAANTGTVGSIAQARDHDTIEAKFKERKLAIPLRLATGGSVTGSAFFPVTPNPQALVVSYTTSAGTHDDIKIDVGR